MRTIAREAGISLGAVSTHITKLVDLGELEIVDKGTQRKSSLYRIQRSPHERQRSSHELSVQPCTEQNRQEEEDTTTSSDSVQFVHFHASRAVAEVRDRQRKGLKVLSPAGLAKTIQANDDFLKESRELWKHRDCANCGGKGHTEEYAPGAGMRSIPCEVTFENQT
jgi:hypothetical protein